jgi:translation initiation factor 1
MGLFAGTRWDLPAHCEKCGKLEAQCDCPPPSKDVIAPSEQSLTTRVEKRKAGRMVTVIRGFLGDDAERGELLTRLKTACGAGGSIEVDTLVLQGDQAARVIKVLEQIGYRVHR